MSMLAVSSHPLIVRDLTVLRDRRTAPDAFRRALQRVSQLLAMEATAHLELDAVEVRTPIERAAAGRLHRPVILVPVLRAGLGMVDAFLSIIPEAQVGHIGLYRNEETLQPVEYYAKYPEALAEADVYILDPMLATGGSAVAAATILRRQGAIRIRLIALVAAPEGVRHMEAAFPDIMVHTAALDRGLNEKGYIVPGLGDAGDRIFGTGAATA
jgi:uracil phosphoribosyltransferase